MCLAVQSEEKTGKSKQEMRRRNKIHLENLSKPLEFINGGKLIELSDRAINDTDPIGKLMHKK